jgi:hypothetical protein
MGQLQKLHTIIGMHMFMKKDIQYQFADSYKFLFFLWQCLDLDYSLICVLLQ